MTEAPKEQEVPAEDLSDDELEDVGGGGIVTWNPPVVPTSVSSQANGSAGGNGGAGGAR